MKRQLGTLAIATIAALVLKFLVFPDAAEFARLYAASQSILLPVVFVLLVFVFGLLLYAFVRKVGPEQQKRMFDISY